jgi:hypothetical protein
MMKIGDRFLDKEEDNLEYVLAYIGQGLASLININGFSYYDPIRIENSNNITEEEFSDICDGDEDDFIPKPPDNDKLDIIMSKLDTIIEKTFEKPYKDEETFDAGDRVWITLSSGREEEYVLTFSSDDEIVLISPDDFGRWSDSIKIFADITYETISALVGPSHNFRLIKRSE